MRFKLVTFPWVCAALCLTLGSCAAPPTETRPNILFVLMDDVRWDDVGAYGHPWVRTPNIDRLAREGVRFDRAYATTPLCSPNRASFLTGQYAHTHGIKDNVDRSALTHEMSTFPRILQAQGYETAYIGKWHMGVDDSPRPGFDYWLSIQGQGRYFDPEMNEDGERKVISGYITDILTDRSIAFMTEEREKPFLLYLGHKAVHPNIFQYADSSTDPEPPDGGFGMGAVHDRHQGLYADREIPKSPNTKSYGEGKPALQRVIEGVEPLGPGTGTDDEVVRNRLRLLTAADEGLGRILAALQERQLLDSTLIVFTSDHGYFYGEHGLDKERRLAYEETSRIPLLVRYPPLIRAGGTVREFALSIDLAPTLLELAASAIPTAMQGRSLVPLLRGEEVTDWRTSFLMEYYSDTVMPRLVTMGYQAVRNDQWKYIHYTELDGMDELYDLAADPFEMHNVVADEEAQAVLEEMKEELNRLLQATGAPGR